MSWSREQHRAIKEAAFRPQIGGYHPDDVERLRRRVLLTMESGLPMDDMDAMALRTVTGQGVDRRQVDGMRTVLSVWRATTPVEDPRAVAERERAEAVQQFTAAKDEPYVYRWSSAQVDLVRECEFPVVGRHATAYDIDDVNTYLDSVIDAMRRGVEIPSPEHARFNSAGIRRGYDPKSVDDFLAHLGEMKPEG